MSLARDRSRPLTGRSAPAIRRRLRPDPRRASLASPRSQARSAYRASRGHSQPSHPSGASAAREFPAKEAGGAPICGCSFLPGLVCTEIILPAVHGDFGLPFTLAPIGAGGGRPVARDGMPHVFPTPAWFQICDPIVRWISVSVIDFAGRVLAMNVEPGETMRKVPHSVELDGMISVGASSPRFVSGAPWSLPHTPSEATAGRKILEQFFQALRRQLQLVYGAAAPRLIAFCASSFSTSSLTARGRLDRGWLSPRRRPRED